MNGELTFIFHDQNDGGRLSGPSKAKALSVVGKGVWKKRRSPKGYNLSLLPQVPRPVAPPLNWRVSEELFSVVRIHTANTLQPIPVQELRRLSPPVESFLSSLRNSIDALKRRDAATMAASVESGLRQVETLVLSPAYCSTFATFVEGVMLLLSNQATDFCRLLLRYILSLAHVVGGPQNPHIAFARGLLDMMDDHDIMQPLAQVFVDAAVDALGLNHWFIWRTKCQAFNYWFGLRRDQYAVDSATIMFNNLVRAGAEFPNAKAYVVQLSETYASILISFEKWALVESTLSDAEGYLDEVVSITQVKGCIRTAVRRVNRLAKVLALQGRWEDAKRLFEKNLSVCTLYLEDDPESVETVAYFGNALMDQKMDDDARRMYVSVDKKLAPYVLAPERPDV